MIRGSTASLSTCTLRCGPHALLTTVIGKSVVSEACGPFREAENVVSEAVDQPWTIDYGLWTIDH